jgi:hypothetical protein
LRGVFGFLWVRVFVRRVVGWTIEDKLHGAFGFCRTAGKGFLTFESVFGKKFFIKIFRASFFGFFCRRVDGFVGVFVW